jgi:hypothetical protein
MSGNYNKELFQKTYSFIPSLQQKELDLLKNELNKEREPERKEKLKAEYLKMVRTTCRVSLTFRNLNCHNEPSKPRERRDYVNGNEMRRNKLQRARKIHTTSKNVQIMLIPLF